MDVEAKAREFFKEHYNCAQSVFVPFALKYGIELALALKIATPFGGGMGHTGGICGAVTGGLMALGLARGISSYDRDKKYACYDLVQAFIAHFRELYGDITCPGLLGHHIGDPAELEKVREENLFHTLCPTLVGGAAWMIEDLLTV